MEDTATGNNSATELAKKFFSDRVKRVQSSDSKVHETLTTKAFRSDQTTDKRAPHFVIDHTTMPISFEEDELFSFSIQESVEVPEFVPAMALQNSLDLTYVTELNESVLSAGHETDANERLSLNSTDDSAVQYGDQFCPFSCISPASFNLSPTSSVYADSYLDDGRSMSQLSGFSDELDSFFDVNVLQKEQCFTYLKRTVV